MKTSDSIAAIFPALILAQSEMAKVIKSETNSHFGNSYADLPAIQEMARPVLEKNGLAIIQSPGAATMLTDNILALNLTTRIIHGSGEWVEETLQLPLSKADPQGAGSAITYGRRYSLAAMLNIVVDKDDDGNAGSGHQAQRPAAARPQAMSKTAAVARVQPPGPAHPPAQGRSADDPHPSLPCPLPDDKTGEPGLVFIGNDYEPRCWAHKWKLKERTRKSDGGSFFSCGKQEGGKWCGAIIDGERLRKFINGIAAAPVRQADPYPSVPQDEDFEGMDSADFRDPGEPPPNFDDDDAETPAPAAPPARGPGGPVTNASPLQKTIAELRTCITKAASEKVARDGYAGLSQAGRDELRRALAEHLKTI